MLEMLTQFRRDLHRIPEIRYELDKTRAYILEALKKTRAKVWTTELGGVLAFFDQGKDYAMAFRADMDALTVQEQTGVDFVSEHEGRMHACGHDGHMAMLLTFCRWLDAHADEPACNVLAVFQPAEESGGGAEHIAKSGVFSEYNVRGIYAFHVDPMLPEGVIAAKPGEFMACASETHIFVHGRAAHVGEWRKGIDAQEACAWLYLKLLEMERSLPDDALRLLKFGRLHSGTAVNIISDFAELGGTMRAFNQDVFNWMRDQTDTLARQCEEKFGVKVDVEQETGYPPVINDREMYEKLRDALADFQFETLNQPEMLAEDFAYYQTVIPGVMMKLGVGGGVRLHSPNLMFREEPLETGVRAFIELARKG